MKKLEIGPGSRRIAPDWDIMDCTDRPDLNPYIKWDICDIPFPVHSNVYDLVYASHVLEHVPWFKTMDTLKEMYRILKPGGVLEVWVPDIEKIARAYLNNESHLDGWYKFNPDKDVTKWFAARLFTYGPDPNWHRAAFDKRYLKKCLLEAGFRNTFHPGTPRGYDHKWINLGMGGTKPTTVT